MEQLEEFSGLAGKEGVIKNQKLCSEKEVVLNTPAMMNIVKRRVLKYIGNVIREEKEKSLHKSFLTANCHSP
jgi:hypothetical protein